MSWPTTLYVRGPDGSGVWRDLAAGITFGSRRLAIIGLSAAGRQAMTSSCGRFIISYNKEIYNATELGRELIAAGGTFRGHSLTEVIVEDCAVWGVRAKVRPETINAPIMRLDQSMGAGQALSALAIVHLIKVDVESAAARAVTSQSIHRSPDVL